MPSKCSQPSVRSIADSGRDSGCTADQLQDRLFQLTHGTGPAALRPVTFRCYGAGAQRDLETSSRINFTFPVDHGKCVRISANAETAAEFCESLVETLGGWKAFEARKLKRGSRR